MLKRRRTKRGYSATSYFDHPSLREGTHLNPVREREHPSRSSLRCRDSRRGNDSETNSAREGVRIEVGSPVTWEVAVYDEDERKKGREGSVADLEKEGRKGERGRNTN